MSVERGAEQVIGRGRNEPRALGTSVILVVERKRPA
jgi:hypothetical protein